MDYDGVAAEVIYHGSQNGEPLPFSGTGKFGIGTFDAEDDSESKRLTELGCDIYDRWLADFCAADPKRLLGMVHLPAWDIDKSVETVKQAAKAGHHRRQLPGLRPPRRQGLQRPGLGPVLEGLRRQRHDAAHARQRRADLRGHHRSGRGRDHDHRRRQLERLGARSTS